MQKNSSESDMLVPLDEAMPEKGEYIMMDTPQGHRPYLRDEESPPGLKETEEDEHSLFFGPAYPRNVRKYYKIIAKFQADATIINRDSNNINELRLWLEAGRCKSYRNDTQTCVSGCAEEGVDKGGLCKFVGEWTECRCYR